jgi:hypothetical protein
MISDEILDLAIARRIITAEQVKALHDLAGDQVPRAPGVPPPLPAQSAIAASPLPSSALHSPVLSALPADEARLDRQSDLQDDEALRFVTSFADIFVSLGLALFFGSAAYFIAAYAGPVAMWAGLAVLAWLVAEFFSRRRRLALPSIILLGLFSASVFMATWQLVAELNPTAPLNWWHPTDEHSWVLANAASLALAGLATAVFTCLHYLRFRVPITIAAMAAAVIATCVGLVYWWMPGLSVQSFNALLFGAGILVFIVAMRFDMSDLQRTTRRTDIAFWLHLLAAPLIVHPLIAEFGHGQLLDTKGAIAVLALFLGLGLISLIIDRRALLVSALTYAGIAFATLLRQTGFADNTPAATLLALGVFILLLSALWRPLRQALLKLLPATLVIRLPHSHVSTS